MNNNPEYRTDKIAGVDVDVNDFHDTGHDIPHNDSKEQVNVVKNNMRANHVVQSHYDLRGRKRTPKPVLRLSPTMDGKSYGNVTLTQIIHPSTKINDENSGIISVCMTQYSLKKGIEKFGSRAETAMIDELKKLHDRETFSPIKK